MQKEYKLSRPEGLYCVVQELLAEQLPSRCPTVMGWYVATSWQHSADSQVPTSLD